MSCSYLSYMIRPYNKEQEMTVVKKFFYTIMVIFSAIALVNVGVGEQEAIKIIPDMKHE